MRPARPDRLAALPAVLAVLAGVAGVAALGGCGTGTVQTLAFPVPPPTVRVVTPPVTPPPDYSGVAQARVPGAATTTVPAIGPGGATVDGTIIGPSGPVAGATVQAERIAGGLEATTQATTAADGSFSIPGVLGGIYRLRAWQAPMLALPAPDVFFLAGNQTQAVTLTLQSFAGVQVTSSMAPDPVEVGGDANLVVSVTQQTVGPDGVVRPAPLPGQSVTIEGGGAWSAAGANPATTDAGGHAEFALTCTAAPAPALVALVTGAAPATLPTSSCVSPSPATTTTTTPGATTTSTTALLSPPSS